MQRQQCSSVTKKEKGLVVFSYNRQIRLLRLIELQDVNMISPRLIGWFDIFWPVLFVCNRFQTIKLVQVPILVFLTLRPALSSHQFRNLVGLYWSGDYTIFVNHSLKS